MISLKKVVLNLFILIPFISFSQEVIEEIIPIDTNSFTYKVIHKETVGDYFQLKRYVFAGDTSTIAIEKNFSNGHQNGLTRVYYPSGKLRVKALYGNDKFQGEWTNYDENGIILIKGVYNFGIKHGYWAYKKEGIYGRYVKGKKHRNWKKKDKNGVKHKAWYWRGEFKRGAEIFNDDYIEYTDTAYIASNNTTDSSLNKNTVAINVDEKYINTVKYLAGNYYLRKVCKDYFRPNKKQRKIFVDENVDYEKDVLKFQVASTIIPIDISYFMEQKKLFKPTLDSLIKANGEAINQELQSIEKSVEKDLEKLSTDKYSNIIFFFTEITDRLVVLEILENQGIAVNDYDLIHADNSNVRMKVLILLDENNEVLEVEYEQREW
tara:strand:- start:8086 stop:9219 length:1134 start_codon:yes stop_codon:yes gene_type:complete